MQVVQENVKFEVLVNDWFSNLNLDPLLEPIAKKRVLSLINSFEDGKWRYGYFQDFVWDNIAETALSKNERDSLVDQHQTALRAAAKNVRLIDDSASIGKGSELAEIFLYGIMKHYYRALPVVPKIFYKQNVSDNAKGSDSVHLVIEDNKDFSIWFGEAKFYNDISDTRLNSIIESVGNSLVTDKLKKENSIITNVKDLNFFVEDDNLRGQILHSLSPQASIDDIKSKLHIPILLLHECNITNSHDCISEGYKKSIIDYHKDRAKSYFTKQIAKLKDEVFKYSEISFHVILFPVPNKQSIIDTFEEYVKFYKKA